MSAPLVYQFKVSLVDSEPLIWRRFQVPTTTSLATLHLTLQRVMGWQNQALHEFRIANTCYSASPELITDTCRDATTIYLSQLELAEGSCFLYMYDFQDGWLHQIELEALLPVDPQFTYPRCLTGAQACPPEASGGVWGYEDLLERLEDTADPEYLDLLDWLGSDFDPDAFDLQSINHHLQTDFAP